MTVGVTLSNPSGKTSGFGVAPSQIQRILITTSNKSELIVVVLLAPGAVHSFFLAQFGKLIDGVGKKIALSHSMHM